jgi:hypothetical protein
VDLSVDPGSLFLILVPSVILSAILALVLLWTSSFERRLAWPWLLFAVLFVALGAVLWWEAGLVLMIAPVLAAVGVAQLWRRRRAAM